ncbi:MAG: hypothetical protein IPI59_05370 [Sphingobacteriales bacterium]|nr:hypothetical protein [Sphingobacteriales bacterium]MBP9140822.1 hypothetical protein [Chitinophagales bacterium]MDA0198362.1 hypothetical protein [Bacteroidota bacterium]MBK6891196.1 hypothetical protein [Sphingobacteriales bacterium]MBK7526979.1 hypothetical protein [Sphingobacteriales bacterium]
MIKKTLLRNFLFVSCIGLLALLFCNTPLLQAQNYTTAVGLHVGQPTGIDVKFFTSERWAVHAIGGFYLRQRGIDLRVFYERHSEFFTPEMQIVLGFGAHVGSYQKRATAAVYGTFGFDLLIPRSPISFQPAFQIGVGLVDERFKETIGGGLALRFALSGR